jgi:hypothetical protein
MVNNDSKYFVFNGKKSSDFGVWASGSGVFETPAKRYEQIDVPGRNGSLIIEDGSFENVELEFTECFIPQDFQQNFSDFKNYMMRQNGYQRLELSWLPDEYRLAAFEGGISPELSTWDGTGRFDVTFNCKPQRFLKSGETPIYFTTWIGASDTQYTYTPIFKLVLDENRESASIWYTIRDSRTIAVDVYWFCNNDFSNPYLVSMGSHIPNVRHIDIYPEALDAGDVCGWQIRLKRNTGDSPSTMEIEGMMDIGGTTSADEMYFKAHFGSSFEVVNPTGCICKPVFRCFGDACALADVAHEEEWTIASQDYSSTTQDIYMDCENEYIYYYDSNGKKKNLANKFTIAHTDGGAFNLLQSFPTLGADKTSIGLNLTSNHSTAKYNILVELTPHWFRI